MSDGIFVLNDDNLVEMTQQPYDNEDVFQALLAKYPNLLAGGQMNRAAPRRWLLISREVVVPSEQDGGGRWSLDHLFLDQDAIPTLIEVKRSSDTRIRREVVGQMLDYAANAVAYWPVEKMRTEYEVSCEVREVDPDQEIRALVGQKVDVEQFWQAVKTNLQAGKIRMVFVADIIPAELQRIVEFLNQQMDPAEVLAVEIKQYVGQGLKTLVPRVIGQTIEAEDRKAVGPRQKRTWDEASFLADLEKNKGNQQVQIVRRVLTWAEQNRLEIKWGTGSNVATLILHLRLGEFRHGIFCLWSWGAVSIYFNQLVQVDPFTSEELRKQLAQRLTSIPGVTISSITGQPEFKLKVLEKEANLLAFLDVMKWVAQEIVSRQS